MKFSVLIVALLAAAASAEQRRLSKSGSYSAPTGSYSKASKSYAEESEYSDYESKGAKSKCLSLDVVIDAGGSLSLVTLVMNGLQVKRRIQVTPRAPKARNRAIVKQTVPQAKVRKGSWRSCSCPGVFWLDQSVLATKILFCSVVTHTISSVVLQVPSRMMIAITSPRVRSIL